MFGRPAEVHVFGGRSVQGGSGPAFRTISESRGDVVDVVVGRSITLRGVPKAETRRTPTRILSVLATASAPILSNPLPIFTAVTLVSSKTLFTATAPPAVTLRAHRTCGVAEAGSTTIALLEEVESWFTFLTVTTLCVAFTVNTAQSTGITDTVPRSTITCTIRIPVVCGVDAADCC